MTKLWVMFFTSLLLVSAMNFYAVIREPDMIEIDEIRNFPRETVKIEGVLTSYVRDPYGEGADRIDLQVQEIGGHSVAKIRWNIDWNNEVPPIGTVVTVEGEVSEWNGRIWLQSNGYGAVIAQGESIEFTETKLVEVGQNPDSFANSSLMIDGWLSESLAPDVTYHSLYLMDNQVYGGADHLLYIQVEGRVIEWVESGSHVRMKGWLQFDERSYRWRLLVQASEVEVLNQGEVAYVDWEAEAYALTYDVGKLVIVSGTVGLDNGEWYVKGPAPTDSLCLLPSDSDLSDQGFEGRVGDWGGRLVWALDEAAVCLDRGFNTTSGREIGDFGDEFTDLKEVATDPFSYIGGDYTFQGWITDPISPDYDKGYVGDGEDYYARDTKLRIEFVGEHSEFIEANQQIRFNATVLWSVADGRVVLEARSWILGDAPPASLLNWGDGYNSWRWDLGKIVQITGEVVADEDGSQWISRSGSDERVCLLGDGTEYLDQLSIGEPVEWVGRLSMEEIGVDSSAMFCIDVR
ncbi:MAG: hypothetical protein QGI73_05985 [Candidatus Thalassarchaeaceae archaeon]|jgi:hypothetical protein|nr:hypothetical protein [Candidatus Thalassarchaeaceae archaeon]